jgi:hypothetical protein
MATMNTNARPVRKTSLKVIAGCLLVLSGSTQGRFARADEKLSFNRDIRPILSDQCFQCHGPDERKREAGLRLDVKELAIRPAESGVAAIVPSGPEQSGLVQRITSHDADELMPPPKSGKKLTPEQIELLQRWIAEGAEYQPHWAFIAPRRPELPAVKDPAWQHNPIDRFILARLEREGLQTSAEATRETLIRRVSLDLTGLPPTPQEVDAFLADQSPECYEKVVDRLLQSPHYGERMALSWLDFARYADSNGFQVDSSRFQWPWRDWVIAAFNNNMSFDQFTIEQLAGDLLPNPTRPQLVATGFNRNHRLNGEGGIIAEEWRVETVIDRLETTSLTWLGLTMNCCRCHDHKYDPISQKEFYQFFAFFNNVPESGTLQGETRNTDPVIPVPTPEQETELARLDQMVNTTEASANEAAKQLPELVAAWEPGFRARLASAASVWNPLEPNEVKSLGGTTFARQGDGSYLAGGVNPQRDTYEVTVPVPPGVFTGLLLECFPDASLPNQSLGRFPNGNFVLTRVEVFVVAPSLTAPLAAKFVNAEADYSQSGWDIKFVVENDRSKGWAVDGPTKRDPRKAIFLVDTPLSIPADATLTVRLHHEALDAHNIGRFRLSMTSLPVATVTLKGAQVPVPIGVILAVGAGARSPEQKAELEKYFRANVDNLVKDADVALAAATKLRDDYKASVPNVMVMSEGPPRDAFLMIRGQYDKPGEKVTAGLPAVMPPLPAGSALNRLGLARWIVDPSHPLTARVWVNRAWEKFFGTGLVKTTENLGSQAEYPSHPELLDWLACEFVQPAASPTVDGQPSRPWNMKALQKLIVMSATYRQSSRVTPQLIERDPENRLLARGPRFRLQGEIVRDQALAASGLLTAQIGGQSVRPYMPDGVWDETSRYGDLRNYKHDMGDGLYRRTMYTIWKRTAAPSTMMLFDAPSREVCTVKRSRTNTPLQALALLNEITYIEAARKLAERMLTEGGSSTVNDRLIHGFRLVTARRPSAEELQSLAEGLALDLVNCRKNPEATAKLIAFGESKPNAALDPAELAAYTLTANILLNLDEAITRE